MEPLKVLSHPSNSWDDVEFHVYMLLQPSKHSKMF